MNDPSAEKPSTESTPPAAPRKNRGALIAVIVAVAIVAGPLLFTALPVEISRWYLAAARNAAGAGETEQAIAALKTASEWADDDLTSLLIRADCFLTLKKYDECLEALEAALKFDEDNLTVHRLRSHTLMSMGRFSEAVAAYEKTIEIGIPPVELNNVAYARALAGEKLELGLEEVNKSLKVLQNANVPDNATFLDTRGFLHLKLGNLNDALADLNQAVSLSELRRAENLAESQQLLIPKFDKEAYLAEAKHNLAIMVYHRALVHEALGDVDAANRDFERVRELGEEPGPDLF